MTARTVPKDGGINTVNQAPGTMIRNFPSDGRDVPLLHYSSSFVKPNLEIQRVIQQNRYAVKPKGLWLSVGTAWKEWCEGEEFRLDGVRHCFAVTLSNDARILRLSNAESLDRFTDEYKCTPPWSTELPVDQHPHLDAWIDWERVVQAWQGIIIDPYCHERRCRLLWYYGWDCASGCIWESKAIKSVESVEQLQFTKETP